MEYTPENITSLKYGEIIVIGTNEFGFHGAGAARMAHEKFGANWGQGFGLMGNSFGIPTKDWKIRELHLTIIGFYARRFLEFAKLNPYLKFYLTKIGMGLAGKTLSEIAPIFYPVTNEPISNVILPKEFWDYYHEKFGLTIPE